MRIALNAMFLPANRIQQRDLEGAERALERARQSLGDDPVVDSCEALLWAQRGEAGHVDAALARALQERPSLGHVHHTWYFAGAALATLGARSRPVIVAP